MGYIKHVVVSHKVNVHTTQTVRRTKRASRTQHQNPTAAAASATAIVKKNRKRKKKTNEQKKQTMKTKSLYKRRNKNADSLNYGIKLFMVIYVVTDTI